MKRSTAVDVRATTLDVSAEGVVHLELDGARRKGNVKGCTEDVACWVGVEPEARPLPLLRCQSDNRGPVAALGVPGCKAEVIRHRDGGGCNGIRYRKVSIVVRMRSGYNGRRVTVETPIDEDRIGVPRRQVPVKADSPIVNRDEGRPDDVVGRVGRRGSRDERLRKAT